MDEPLLEISGARVERDGRPILEVDSFAIRAGEHLAILGPNGAGKSTLVGLLTREILPLHTEPAPVLWAGQPLVELADVRRVVGVVSSTWQENVAVHLPVRDVVVGGLFGALGIPPHLRDTVTPEDRAVAGRAMTDLGIGHLADRDMRTLSTGEARRALIARALVHDPAVLVLDEPCAGLDPTAAWHLRETMRQLAAGERTLVLVTHHVEDIVRGIDRTVLMRDAGIAADGPTARLLSSERLSELFGVPLELECRDGEYRLW